MKRKVKRPFDNEQFRKGYVAGMLAAEKELNTELLHFAEKAHKIMSEGTFPDYGIKINFKDSHNTIATNLDMETEEKAKRYDEALERARMLNNGKDVEAGTTTCEYIFPELKESEDEIHRKWILEYLYDGLRKSDEQFKGQFKSAIDWLEKQKEQIPYIDFVIKPHKGDDTNPYDMGVSEAQDYATHRGFDIPFNDGEVYVDERHITQTVGNILRWADEHPKEQKPSINIDQLKSIMLQYLQEAANEKEDSDIEADTDKWARKILGYDFEQKPAEWGKNDTVFLNEIIDYFDNKTVRLQHDIDMYSHWLKSLPERFNLQPKNEWSKEDLQHKSWILECLADGERKMPEYAEDFRAAYKWLKSLSPQPHTVSIKDVTKFGNLEYERGVKDGIQHAKNHHWKPSEEQMQALSETIAFAPDTFKPKCTLVTLQDDLKNL